ncbi:MAG: ACT domain-containing protein [Armatimonadota bacterium]
MDGERNLAVLISTMEPRLIAGKWVFRTSEIGFDRDALETALLMFREPEGVTIISPATPADDDLPVWAMITLSIHSSLEAVGFLAAITTSLAAMDIPVNAVSAYYHDHIFVPYARRDDALECLQCMMRETDSGCFYR